MCHLKAVFLLLLMLAMGGCNSLPTPQEAGMTPVAANIYAEPALDNVGRVQLVLAVDDARQLLGNAYGGVVTHPTILACMTDSCYTRVGGSHGSAAEALDDRIVLSPRGQDRHFIAHEWSHAELFARLQPAAWRNVPQWFNEGLAVAVSQEPDYSESFWQSLVDGNLPRPALKELLALQTLPQWVNAIGFYDQQQNSLGIRADGHPLYAAAGHVVRPWLQKAGSRGLNELIRRLNAGQSFDTAYQAATVSGY